MIDFSAGGRFSDQELTMLFRHYLPLQPLPADLAARVKALVLAEVAVTLRCQKLIFRLPFKFLHRSYRGFWSLRRRR
jgi:hypothetical protein